MILKTAANAMQYSLLWVRRHHNMHHDDETTGQGQGLVEYALILVLVAVVVIVVLALLGPAIGNVFSEIACKAIIDPQGVDCATYFAGS
jgi:pilus assembly protein Flp/PilA